VLGAGVMVGVILLLAACEDSVRGTGMNVNEQRDLPEFTELSVNGTLSAEVTIGSPQSVTVSGDSNIVPLIRTEVRSGRLVVEPRNRFRSDPPVRVVITVAQLGWAGATGALSITVTGLRTESFTVRASGASTIRAAGSADRLDAEASGASRLRLEDVNARDARVDASGASSIDLQVSSTLEGDASGASSIRYGGSPQVNVKSSGASSVRNR